MCLLNVRDVLMLLIIYSSQTISEENNSIDLKNIGQLIGQLRQETLRLLKEIISFYEFVCHHEKMFVSYHEKMKTNNRLPAYACEAFDLFVRKHKSTQCGPLTAAERRW